MSQYWGSLHIIVLARSALAFTLYGLPTKVALFVLLALGIGGKENRSMKKKITYTDEPLGDVQVVEDYLPPPEQLVFKEENVKVTLSLSKSSINFFKQTAAADYVSYQQMIRRLLNLYVARHQQ